MVFVQVTSPRRTQPIAVIAIGGGYWIITTCEATRRPRVRFHDARSGWHIDLFTSESFPNVDQFFFFGGPLEPIDTPMGDELLTCAKWFHHHCPEARALPLRYESETECLTNLQSALLFEAHHAMREPTSAPDEPISNAVDLRTTEPGIASVRGGRVEIRRSDAEVREVRYPLSAPTEDVDESEPPPRMTPSARKRSLEASERAAQRAHRRRFRAPRPSHRRAQAETEARICGPAWPSRRWRRAPWPKA